VSPREFVAALAIALSGCQEPPPPPPLEAPRFPWVSEILGSATHVELFSLNGDPRRVDATAKKIGSWQVLGESGVLDEPARERSKRALQALIANDEGADAQRCFMPHHALVAEHDGHRLEAILCFRCGNAELHYDGELRDKLSIGREGAAVLDELLGHPPTVGGS
jgi:hypothetical protein